MNKNVILGLIVFIVAAIILFVGSKPAGTTEDKANNKSTGSALVSRKAQEFILFQEISGGTPEQEFKIDLTYPSDMTPAINTSKTRATLSSKDISLRLTTIGDTSVGLLFQTPDNFQLEKSPLDKPVYRIKVDAKDEYYYTDLLEIDTFVSCTMPANGANYKACTGKALQIAEKAGYGLLYITCETTDQTKLAACDQIVGDLKIVPLK